MPDYAEFKAPRGTNLKLSTWAISAILIALPLAIVLSAPYQTLWWIHLIVPFGFIFVFSLFAIRGYGIDSEVLYVYRLGWKTKIRLEFLLSVEHNPGALSGSVRAFGNSGLFCIAGDFHNTQIGSFRLLATDRKNAVILRFPRHSVVVTPGDPEAFVNYLSAIKGLN